MTVPPTLTRNRYHQMCERRQFGLAASGFLSFPSNELRLAKLSAKTGDCLAGPEHPFEAETVYIGGRGESMAGSSTSRQHWLIWDGT